MMAIDVYPFRKEHTGMFTMHEKQHVSGDIFDPSFAETHGNGMTVCAGGEVIACGGMVGLWEDRWLAWSMLSKKAGPHMVAITRVAKQVIDMQRGRGRVEMIVKTDFQEAHRWAVILGFKYHHHEEQFLPGKVDADIYVRFL